MTRHFSLVKSEITHISDRCPVIISKAHTHFPTFSGSPVSYNDAEESLYDVQPLMSVRPRDRHEMPFRSKIIWGMLLSLTSWTSVVLRDVFLYFLLTSSFFAGKESSCKCSSLSVFVALFQWVDCEEGCLGRIARHKVSVRVLWLRLC